VNNLQQRGGRELNSQLSSCKSNAVATRLPSHPVVVVVLGLCNRQSTSNLLTFQEFVPRELCYRDLGSRNSVRPSVRPSHACFVTNPKNLPAIFFIPHERALLLVKCDFSYSCAAGDKISTDFRARAVSLRQLSYLCYKNLSGDEIANVHFYSMRPEATRIR